MTVVTTVLHPENDPTVDLHPETDAGQVTDFLNKTYPINSIYMSVDSTSPASLFGGSWARIQNGFLLSAGYNSISGGTIGGSLTHLHTLSKYRAFSCIYKDGNSLKMDYRDIESGSFTSEITVPTSTITYSSESGHTKAVGLTGRTELSSDIYPPYLAVYMWKRIA